MKFGDYVICKVKKINPHSVFVEIIDEKKEGMIHISEVASGWIKNIRKHVRENQIIVAKILKENHWFHLSLKRVTEADKKEIMKKYNLEIRGRKLLKIVAKHTDMNYKELKKKIEQRFTIYEAFSLCLRNPKMLEFLPKEVVEVMKDVAKKNIKIKEKKIILHLSMFSLSSNGLKIIKQLLEKIQNLGVEIIYLGAPNYLLKYKTRKKDVQKIINKIDNIIKHERDVKYKIEVHGYEN